MHNTSTPLSLNTSTTPETTEMSYLSATSTSIPATSTSIPELIQSRKHCFSRLYHITILFGVLLCTSLLIYLVVHVQFDLKLHGSINSDIGNVNFTLESEGELNLSTNSSVTTNSSIPSQLWKQQYVDLLSDSP